MLRYWMEKLSLSVHVSFMLRDLSKRK